MLQCRNVAMLQCCNIAMLQSTTLGLIQEAGDKNTKLVRTDEWTHKGTAKKGERTEKEYERYGEAPRRVARN